MEKSKIRHMKHSVPSVPRGPLREGELFAVIQARRRLCPPRRGGRAWVNGREVGGPDARLAHLATTHD